MAAVVIGHADSPELREAVYRFRYDIYVREMSRPQRDADHALGRVVDALDATGCVLVARNAETADVVGTVRTNPLQRGSVGRYESLYGLVDLSLSQRHVTSVTTRLMVATTRRRGSLAVRLAQTAYRFSVSNAIENDYMDCNDHLVPFFSRLGYRWLRRLEHPEYGAVNLMRLDLNDTDYLARVESPLLVARSARWHMGDLLSDETFYQDLACTRRLDRSGPA